jgi:O-antigen ligase
LHAPHREIVWGRLSSKAFHQRRELRVERMTALSILTSLDRGRWVLLSDWLALGIAVSLPWSTTATGILIVLWLVATLPTLDGAMLRRELASAAGFLPVLLWALAAVGMLWADASWAERLGGLGKFHRLLLIPLLLAHFRRSERGAWVLYGFFGSMLGVLLVSWALVLIPGLPWRAMHQPDVPAKDYIFQSAGFLTCAFALLGYACEAGRERRSLSVSGYVALACLFLANILFVVTSRTALLVMPVLLLLLGWREFRWKGLASAVLLGSIVAVTVWFASPYLRDRLVTSVKELQAYRTSDAPNSTGLHLEFLRKSLLFVETAPIIGHGTGSIPEQFRHAAVGGSGASSVAAESPHNQIFGVAIQLGLVGAVALLAMWVAHFLLFGGGGLTSWIGAIIVTQNMVASLFDTYLFAFGTGWLYVFGVGVAGGMVLRDREFHPGRTDIEK